MDRILIFFGYLLSYFVFFRWNGLINGDSNVGVKRFYNINENFIDSGLNFISVGFYDVVIGDKKLCCLRVSVFIEFGL